ncbi:hypothetical protein [Stenotrophomonas maltophilia]|uniref:hypothetical protein n=1 Tax=Stenotrophomonas maltophilia TaxID=40324 RepID=UPI001180AA03|nr:hypothetical protein [Stenotrophomonas maltophilia]MCZ7842913.1 hypothetical protein [Stenotrophomonas maltophilia]
MSNFSTQIRDFADDAIERINSVLSLEPRNDFVKEHTGFPSIDELLASAGVDASQDQALAEFCSSADADTLIQKLSKFESWQDFLGSALQDALEHNGLSNKGF